MTESKDPARDRQPQVPVPKKRLMLPVIGTRRNFLINRPYQLRITGLVVGMVALLLILLNWALYLASAKSTLELVSEAPQIEDRVRAEDRAQVIRLAIGSAIFLVGITVMTVLETHKTAGAAFNIARHMRLVGEGDYSRALKLRRGDNLGELEAAYNYLRSRLADNTEQEIAHLEELARRLEAANDATARRVLTQEILQLASDKRRLLEGKS